MSKITMMTNEFVDRAQASFEAGMMFIVLCESGSGRNCQWKARLHRVCGSTYFWIATVSFPELEIIKYALNIVFAGARDLNCGEWKEF